MCGETDRAAERLTASFEWWERSGDAFGYMIARSLLGGVRVNQGRYDEAAALFAANEAALRDAGDESWLGHASFHLGLIAWVQGDEARARSLLRDAVEHFDRSRAPANAIDPLRYLGLLACAAGDLDEAAIWFGEEVTRLRQEGNRAATRGGAGRRGDPGRGARGVAAGGAALRPGGGAAQGRGRGVLPACP